ncbi:helix-turn-helix domain-containing protein [Aeromonas hydrophila]|uniref:helix-turn-helix domain-containing protein n=1 Tax=Aeromonas hydrophila TaxID=644 RepID=UPI00208EA1AF|nr:helix-turn-helix domain-containing protein [Aeromonas hydrophila]MCO4201224.1 helix-turn-helix domain-containing protein [Aeromonas hydrophila]
MDKINIKQAQTRVNDSHYEIIKMYEKHYSIAAIARAFGVSRNTVYRAIEKHKELGISDASR